MNLPHLPISSLGIDKQRAAAYRGGIWCNSCVQHRSHMGLEPMRVGSTPM